MSAIARLVGWSARHPVPVLAAALIAAFVGAQARRSIGRDVIPDLSEPQLGVVADWMGHPASEVAVSVTKVLTDALAGTAGASAINGSSMSGMAYIDIVFGGDRDPAAVRRDIADRVERARPMLPPAARVTVGPTATGTGWVFVYALVAPALRVTPAHAGGDAPAGLSLLTLRRHQDDVLGPALSKITGVAEVAPIGGQIDETTIETRPASLRTAGISVSDVVASARATLAARPDAGPAELGNAAVGSSGTLAIKDVARVRTFGGMAAGMADLNGYVPAVGGIVIAERQADVTALIRDVRRVIERERARLPDGVTLAVIYDRSELAGRVHDTLLRALAEEVAVVVLVVLLFLLHGRSALLPMATLPVVVLTSFVGMWAFGVPATVVSLGGIAIALGIAVDADIVALEAGHRAIESTMGAARPPDDAATTAAGSFAPVILTSVVIAGLAFVPVFAFGGETGRLLRPLAATKTLVIAAAAVVSLTLAPALRRLLLRGRIVRELDNPLTRALVRVYRPFVHFALSRPGFTLATAVLAAASCVPVAAHLGAEFLPRMDEGDLLFMPTTAPGVSPMDAAAQLAAQDQALAAQPEVAAVFGKVGRADTATDPAPYSMAETIVRLRPRSAWPTRTLDTSDLVRRLDRVTHLPGWTNAWTFPARARADMMSTGVRTPVAVRIVAADLARIDTLAAAVRQALLAVPGTRSASYESLGGEQRLTFDVDDTAAARHGVDPALVRSTADLLLAGGQIGDSVRDGRRVRVSISLAAAGEPSRSISEELLRDATVRGPPSPSLLDDGRGQPVPLALLGRPRTETTPASLRTERGEVVGRVFVDLDAAADVGGYVDRARRAVATDTNIHLGPGERLDWIGQYQLLAAGRQRLAIIAPLVLLAMLGLLYLLFRSFVEAGIVLVSVPFALVGSFWTLYLLDYNLSPPVWVGLLSVAGLAMQTGVVMVVYIDEAFHRRVRAGQLVTRDDIVAAHAEGTVRRLRPKLMTITTMAAALLPLLWAEGAGAELMKRIAAPMLGGLVTSAFLTLEVIPVLYTMWRAHQLAVARRTGVPLAAIVGRVPGWLQNLTS